MRLKRDIQYLATLENGLKVYSFKYLWDEKVRVGVMAQDLLKDPAYAHTVVRAADGFYAVDYGALGLKMTTLAEWRKRGIASVYAVTAPIIMPSAVKIPVSGQPLIRN